MENSIEEDMKYIHKTLNDMKIKDEDAFMSAVATIFRDYKRVLKENEELRVKWDKDTHILQNQLDLANAKNIEKDKIIDLMSEQLAGLAIFDIDKDEPLILGDKEEIKEYFTKKAEKGGIKE